MTNSLTLFHPIVQDWFSKEKGQPTDVQNASWPVIARREHLLVTAPTGSGKTLTAFLWAINQLATRAWSGGRVRVLYISPLKALNTDIRQNLVQPLAQIREGFIAQGFAFPDIQVLTRSGDTPQKDRRKMLRYPPDILITTPESLNLLLSSKSGQLILGDLKTVILDEIHACAGSKRGVHLMSAVDRLVRLSGEFQRIALSATLADPDAIARFVGGFTMTGSCHDPVYVPRTVTQLASTIQKEYQLTVEFPERPAPEALDEDEDYSVWDLLAESFSQRIAQNRATLLFTNGRRLCEKLAYKVNRASESLVAYAHHGSLSKDLRKDVEDKLRSGGLKAIVATSSLEMGIDIGDLDEVIMVQSPFSVSSAVQRLGRAGHKVGIPSSGRLFPAHAQDLIACAVLARAVREKDIEPLKPVNAPLDVLAQVLISMTAMESWDLDELFAFIRTNASFHSLSRKQFDLVVNMLAGQYARTRIRDLNPRVSLDRLKNRIEAKKGALLALYMSGGTIPDRGYYKLRHAQTNARIGELDEEYVWEAKVGQIATVGSQNWKITRITHDDVFALPAGHRGMDAPFWIAESMDRDFHFSSRMGTFLENADQFLSGNKKDRETYEDTLVRDYAMDQTGANELVRFLRSQKQIASLPHRRHFLLEYVRSGPGAVPGTMLVIHTLWGGRVNRPFALALAGAWKEKFGESPEIFPGNDAVVVQLPGPVEPETIVSLVTCDNIDRLILQELEGSGFFGARFRECAGRALLVTRNRINQRMPLWMIRLQSQKLMGNILEFPDFPILLETWRTCLDDEFDIKALKKVLDELDRGEIIWSVAHTAKPSPFAAALAWNQINQYMYQQDQPAASRSNLGDSLIQEVLFSPELRPVIPENIIETFELKRQRLAKGYGPDTPADMVDWVRDRVALPEPEWDSLTRGLAEDIGHDQVSGLLEMACDRLVKVQPKGSPSFFIASLEMVGDIKAGWYEQKEQPAITDISGRKIETVSLAPQDETASGLDLFSQWLSFYGPRTPEWCGNILGLEQGCLESYVSDLTDTRTLVSGLLGEEADTQEICDARNLDILIRMHRAKQRPGFDPLDIGMLPLLLAHSQGLIPGAGQPQESLDQVFEHIERLSCMSLPAGLWEREVLPARVRDYHPAFMDSLLQEGDCLWLGRPKETVLLCLDQDVDLLPAREKEQPNTEINPEADPGIHQTGQSSDQKASLAEIAWERICELSDSLYDYYTLKQVTGLDDSDLITLVWEKVWQGKLSSRGLSALRTGIMQGFKIPDKLVLNQASQRTTGRVGRRARGRAYRSKPRASANVGRTLTGQWFRPEYANQDMDLVDREEILKDRIRLLLDRYGVLFRELLAREMPGFRWADSFKTLYLMELAGEVLAGSFFKDIQGPQFISHEAFRRLKAGLDTKGAYWINAADPASACGLGSLSKGLPKRLASNHLVYKGAKLVLVSMRKGKELDIFVDPDDENLPTYFAPLSHMLTRSFDPLTRISIETINKESAVKSPYRKVLESLFEVVAGHKALDLYQRRIP